MLNKNAIRCIIIILLFVEFVSIASAEVLESYDIDTYTYTQGDMGGSGSFAFSGGWYEYWKFGGTDVTSLQDFYGLYYYGIDFPAANNTMITDKNSTEYPVTISYAGKTYATGTLRYSDFTSGIPDRIDAITIHFDSMDIDEMISDGLTLSTVFDFDINGCQIGLASGENWYQYPGLSRTCSLGAIYVTSSVLPNQYIVTAYRDNWQTVISGSLTEYGIQTITIDTNKYTTVETKTVTDTSITNYYVYPSQNFDYLQYPIVINVTNPLTGIKYNTNILSPNQTAGLNLLVSPDPPIINTNYTASISGVFDINNYNQINYYTVRYYTEARNTRVDSWQNPKILLSRVNTTTWNKSILDRNAIYIYNIDQIATNDVLEQVFDYNYNMTIDLGGYYTTYVSATDTNGKIHTTGYNFTVSGADYGYSDVTFICMDVSTGDSLDYFNLFAYNSINQINYSQLWSRSGTYSGLTVSVLNNWWYAFNVSMGGYEPYTSDEYFIDKNTTLRFYLTPIGTTTYGTIKLYVYDGGGNVLSDTKCVYSGGGYNNSLVYSNTYYYSFANFPYDNYTFSISKDNYITSNISINFNTPFASRNVYLSPIEGGVPTPTIVQSTPEIHTILDSIKYGFIVDVLGISYTEENYETINLLFGVIIIMACALIMFWVTGEPLALILGVIIGYMVNLLMGLWPLWTLFVGIAIVFTIWYYTKGSSE